MSRFKCPSLGVLKLTCKTAPLVDTDEPAVPIEIPSEITVLNPAGGWME